MGAFQSHLPPSWAVSSVLCIKIRADYLNNMKGDLHLWNVIQKFTVKFHSYLTFLRLTEYFTLSAAFQSAIMLTLYVLVLYIL